MRASFEDIRSKKGADSYLAYQYGVSHFPFQWHYHPEYELTLIINGSGGRMVGDSHETFEAGDLVLIGPELPHTWVSDKKPGETASAVVIQFSEEFISSFCQHTECEKIHKLLSRSTLGLHFPIRISGSLWNDIIHLSKAKGVDRITGLLQVLNQLSAKRSRILASSFFQPAKSRMAESRINKVCGYIQRHSSEDISLLKVASLVNLSESAFCKFFKRTTGKTYSDYLGEIRIGHACHLLTESDDTISVIAYRSGFESLTYFNRVFLRKKGLRPGEYRKRFSPSIQNNSGGGKVPVLPGKN
jgi:AraC-like DNA-binding protein